MAEQAKGSLGAQGREGNTHESASGKAALELLQPMLGLFPCKAVQLSLSTRESSESANALI